MAETTSQVKCVRIPVFSGWERWRDENVKYEIILMKSSSDYYEKFLNSTQGNKNTKTETSHIH